MKIMIDVPEELYKVISEDKYGVHQGRVYDIIRNGTPLPGLGHWSRKTKVDAYDIEGVKTWGIKCQCDRCTFTTIVVEDFGYYSYCPNCGAKMAESEDEE